jgi:hypothetical protein
MFIRVILEVEDKLIFLPSKEPLLVPNKGSTVKKEDDGVAVVLNTIFIVNDPDREILFILP